MMRSLCFIAVAVPLAACDIEQGPPIYNNPPPSRIPDLPSGQPHTKCFWGEIIC
jgi:hypothetical protein